MSELEQETDNYSFGYRFLLKGEGKISTKEFSSVFDLVGDKIVELGGQLETMGCNPEASGERNISVFLDCGVTDKEKAMELKKSLLEWTSVQKFCEQVVSEDELKFINEE